MLPENLSTPTPQEQRNKESPQYQLVHQRPQHQDHQQQQQQQHQQHMSHSMVTDQAHAITSGLGGGGGGGAARGTMSDQGGHSSLEHAHSMAEHAAHSMLDLRETGGSLEHLAGGGGGGGGSHTSQSLADLGSHHRDHQGLDSGQRHRDSGGLTAGGLPGDSGSGGGTGGSLTPTMHQMNQNDNRGDMPGSTNGGGAGGLLPRPMSGLGAVASDRVSLSQPMRNLTPSVDGRGDGVVGGRVSVGHSIQDHISSRGGGGQGSSAALNFSPNSHYQLPPGRVPIIPKRGRPPGSGHHQQGLHNLYKGGLQASPSSSSSSSLHGHHNLHQQQGSLNMRGLSDPHHHNTGDSGSSSNHNGRASTGLYRLDSSGQQLNSRPGSVLMSEPSDSRDLGGRANYSTSSSGERNHSSSSASLIEETIAAVASNFNRASPNGGLMPGPLPPNSGHGPGSSVLGGLGGLLPPRSNSALGGGGGHGDDSLADLVGRGQAHGIPMLSERASQSLSGIIDDGDSNHPHHHGSTLHHGGSSSGHGGREIEKTHPCLICLKMFRSKQQLAQHSLVHTGIRKHICTFCDRAFKQLSHLQQHVRIHTGERKYMCKFCDRGFKQLSHLQKHITVHTEVLDMSTAPQNPAAKGKRGRKPKNLLAQTAVTMAAAGLGDPAQVAPLSSAPTSAPPPPPPPPPPPAMSAVPLALRPPLPQVPALPPAGPLPPHGLASYPGGSLAVPAPTQAAPFTVLVLAGGNPAPAPSTGFLPAPPMAHTRH